MNTLQFTNEDGLVTQQTNIDLNEHLLAVPELLLTNFLQFQMESRADQAIKDLRGSITHKQLILLICLRDGEIGTPSQRGSITRILSTLEKYLPEPETIVQKLHEKLNTL